MCRMLLLAVQYNLQYMYTYPGDSKGNYLYYCSRKGHGLTKDFQFSINKSRGQLLFTVLDLQGMYIDMHSMLYFNVWYINYIKAITCRNTLFGYPHKELNKYNNMYISLYINIYIYTYLGTLTCRQEIHCNKAVSWGFTGTTRHYAAGTTSKDGLKPVGSCALVWRCGLWTFPFGRKLGGSWHVPLEVI